MSLKISPMLQTTIGLKKNAANNLSTSNKQNIQNPHKTESANTAAFTGKNNTKKQKDKHLLTGGILGAASGFAGGMKFALFGRDKYEQIYREGSSLKQAIKSIDFIEKKFPKKLGKEMLDLAASDMKKDKDKFKEIIATSKKDAEDFILYSADLINKYKYTMAAIGAIGIGILGIGAGAVIHKVKTKKEN